MDIKGGKALQRGAEAVLTFEIARLKHRRWRYDGPVLMLRSSRRLRHNGPEKRGPFSRHLAGDVQWFDVGGAHHDVRRAGHEAMASQLRAAVTLAQYALAGLQDDERRNND